MSARKLSEPEQIFHTASHDGSVTAVNIRGLLLDFGSVISVSIFERHRHTERMLGLPQGTLNWQGPLAPHTDPLWQSMQRDEISEREYWARRAYEISALVGESSWDMRTLLTRVREKNPKQVVRPEMRTLIVECRARGITVGILSNEMELFYGEAFLAEMDLLQFVDVVVDGTHTEILKPDLRAYAQALDQMHLDPGNVLFVDDQFRNIAGAVRAGLQTQYFDLRDVHGNIAAIRARLGLSAQELR